MPRISSGILKGIHISAPRHIRPTQEKVRQVFFNIISDMVADSFFVDLFAGSGAMGIEAISRGAREVAFLESDPVCIRQIKSNMSKLSDHISGIRWQLYSQDAVKAIAKIAGRGMTADIVFIDPPYGYDLGKKSLNAIAGCDMLTATGLVCLEHSSREILEPEAGSLVCLRKHRVGDTVLSFYRRKN